MTDFIQWWLDHWPIIPILLLWAWWQITTERRFYQIVAWMDRRDQRRAIKAKNHTRQQNRPKHR